MKLTDSIFSRQQSLQRSVVRITSGKERGTGFWVKGRNNQVYILTCTHVLQSGCEIEIRLSDGNKSYIDQIPATIIAQKPVSSGDVTLLEVREEDKPANLQALQLLDLEFKSPPLIHTFGFPEQFPEHGRPASGRVVGSAQSNDKSPLFQIQTEMDIREGFSGAPICYSVKGFSLGIVSDAEDATEKKPDLNPYATTAAFIGQCFPEYLEVQSISPYHAWLAGLYHDIVLNDDKDMRLSDIYIESHFGIHELCLDAIQRKAYENQPKFGSFYRFNSSIHEFVNGVLNGEAFIDNKVKTPNLILLLGYPGQGKTSFTKRLLYDFCQPENNKPIYLVRLRFVPDPKMLLNTPFLVIRDEIIQQSSQELEDATPEIDFRNSLVVLDGLDELCIKSDMSSQDVDDLVKEISRSAERFPGLRIVLTSRLGYINLEKLANRDILILQLAQLDLEQQIHWLNRYHVFHPESHLTASKLQVYHEDTKFETLKELATQPILLQMIASLEEDLTDAVNRAAIYEKLFSQLVERSWSKGGNIEALKNIDTNLLREALQDIAHAIFHSEKEYLYKSALTKLEKVKDLNDALDNNLDVWRSVMVAFYMDEVKKGSRKEDESDTDHDYAIEFLHKSLAEFLCAEKIWRDIRCIQGTKRKKQSQLLDDLYDTFGKKMMSNEITSYLIEIIKNDRDSNKDELANTLYSYLPEWLSCDFLPVRGSSNPINTIQSIFYGYWTVLSHLKIGEPYIYEDNKGSIVQLIRIVLHSNYRFFNLRNAILVGTDLAGINLTGADLGGANLEVADLGGANLEVANLKGAILFGAKLGGADLGGANLAGADLQSAYLAGANLASADLTGANLGGAYLGGVNLASAYLANAYLAGDFLAGANLSGAYLKNTFLGNAYLAGANLDGTNLNGASLHGAYLEGANIPNKINNSKIQDNE